MLERKLFEGDNLYEGEKLIGYSRSHGHGWRIIIVVDDYFKAVSMGRAPTAHAFGLREIWNAAIQLENTRAVGFFNLPQRDDDEDNAIRSIISTIGKWIADVGDSECKVYTLIDYYAGLETIEANPPGVTFADYWIRQTNILTQDMKAAHLTIAANADIPNPRQLRVFSKVNISEAQHSPKKLPLDFLEWLDVNAHPLEKLWTNTTRWFSSDDESLLMKHSFDSIYQDFESKDKKQKYRANKYKKYVENELGVIFPKSWWSNPKAIRGIHESLKCICGAFFCGEASSPARRHISIGAAYLIALMTYQRIYGDLGNIASDQIWDDCLQATSPLFPLQDTQTSKLSAMSLYDFFLNILSSRQVIKSPIKSIFFDNSGKILQIQLSWRADQCADDRQESLAQSLTKTISGEKITVPSSSNNTRSSLLRLWRNMAISENGFMGPGSIYLEGDKLVISSTR